MADLRPSILDDLGIIPALSCSVEEYQKTYSHIFVENQIGTLEQEVPDSLKTPIFRISQEAMNNIAKHSQASLLTLSLRKDDDKIELKIRITVKASMWIPSKKEWVFSTMKERAQLRGFF